MTSVSRNGSWVMMIMKIRAGSSGPRRRHRSARTWCRAAGRRWAVVGGLGWRCGHACLRVLLAGSGWCRSRCGRPVGRPAPVPGLLLVLLGDVLGELWPLSRASSTVPASGDGRG